MTTSYARRTVPKIIRRKENERRENVLTEEAAWIKKLAEGIVEIAQTGTGHYTIHPSIPDSTDVRDRQGRPIVYISPIQAEYHQPTRNIFVYGYRGDHTASVSITDGGRPYPRYGYDGAVSFNPEGEIARKVKRYLPTLPTEPTEAAREIHPRGKEQ